MCILLYTIAAPVNGTAYKNKHIFFVPINYAFFFTRTYYYIYYIVYKTVLTVDPVFYSSLRRAAVSFIAIFIQSARRIDTFDSTPSPHPTQSIEFISEESTKRLSIFYNIM